MINVTWSDAQRYVDWLSEMTGKPYRLLSEAEWEYAARARTQTAYSWGEEIGKGNANCDGCGSQWDKKQTAPVGSFKRNAFGLHDMHGNVWEWVEDCYNGNYYGAPTDGSAWSSGDSDSHVVRGGSWNNIPQNLRSANRDRLPNEKLHAVLHVVIENQIALGDEIPVQNTAQRLMAEGLDRHEAIHCIASVLAECACRVHS